MIDNFHELYINYENDHQEINTTKSQIIGTAKFSYYVDNNLEQYSNWDAPTHSLVDDSVIL